ncbi:hypothetical protein ACHAWF_016586 [Thalassiosira exigua]
MVGRDRGGSYGGSGSHPNVNVSYSTSSVDESRGFGPGSGYGSSVGGGYGSVGFKDVIGNGHGRSGSGGFPGGGAGGYGGTAGGGGGGWHRRTDSEVSAASLASYASVASAASAMSIDRSVEPAVADRTKSSLFKGVTDEGVVRMQLPKDNFRLLSDRDLVLGCGCRSSLGWAWLRWEWAAAQRASSMLAGSAH